jgi:hypothetical protein
MRQLVAQAIDPYTGDPVPAGSGRAFTEYFKRDPSGRIEDTQFRIVSRADSGPFQRWSDDDRHYGDSRPPFSLPTWRFGPRGHADDEDQRPRPPLRIDPDYFWRRLD